MKQASRFESSIGRSGANLRQALLLLLSAFIPTVVICGVVGFLFVRSQMAALDKMIDDRTNALVVALSRELETQIQLLSILSESPRLDPPIEQQDFAEIGERLRARVPIWEILRVSDMEGRLLLSIPESNRAQASQRVVDSESHKKLFASKRPIVGNIALGPRKLPAFPIRVPVLRRGEVVFALTAVIRPSSLNKILQANGLPKSWVGWITDGEGRLVATTAPVPHLITFPAEQLVQAKGLLEHELSGGRLYSGQDLRIAAAAVRGTDWTVSVGMPMAEYQRISAQELYILVATGGAVTLLVVSGLFVLLRELEARRRKELELASWQRMDALGKLTGGIAHDFNNLLMVFQSSAESLKRRPDDGARVERLSQGMLDTVSRGRTLTQRLLSYARRSNQNARPTRLQDHVETLTEILGKAAQGVVELRIAFPDDLWPVNIDPQAFETSLINLATNAREAMPGGGLVDISARNVPDLRTEMPRLKGPGIVITVADNGTGISAEDQTRIFDPFYTTKQGGAPGLGLSQVYAFAEQSGGAVTLSRGEPRGAVFNLHLPRDTSASTSPESQAAKTSKLPAKVLVVDDTPSVLEASKLTLEDLGIAVIAVPTGRAALAALHRDKGIEAVLTDVRMPGISGLKLAEYIKVLNPRVAIVLMTGYNEDLEMGRSVDLPILVKPFTSESLIEAFTTSWMVSKTNSDQTG